MKKILGIVMFVFLFACFSPTLSSAFDIDAYMKGEGGEKAEESKAPEAFGFWTKHTATSDGPVPKELLAFEAKNDGKPYGKKNLAAKYASGKTYWTIEKGNYSRQPQPPDVKERVGSFGAPLVLAVAIKKPETDESYRYFINMHEDRKANDWRDYSSWEDVKAGTEFKPGGRAYPFFRVPKRISVSMFKNSYSPWMHNLHYGGGARGWLFCQVDKSGKVKVFDKPPRDEYYMRPAVTLTNLQPLSVHDLVFFFPPGTKDRLEFVGENEAKLTPLVDWKVPDDVEGVVSYKVDGRKMPQGSILKADQTYLVMIVPQY